MKLVQSLATDYWIENTNRIYEEDLHISTPVMEAYEAGFRKALEVAIADVPNTPHGLTGTECLALVRGIPDRDDGFGPSLYDQAMAEDSSSDDQVGFFGRFFRWISLF